MRTTLFVSTLFAVSLVGGVALAEKPPVAPKEPKGVVDRIRSHGNIVDKNYRVADRAAAKGHDRSTQVRQTKNPFDKSANRVNCSESGVDCTAPRAATHANGFETNQGSSRVTKAPAFLDKILGSDRMSCNEADECSMSNRAVKRAWSHAAGGKSGHAHGATVPLAKQQQHERAGEQASSDRMVCNEADECMMSSKAAKKDWSYAAVKSGTWTGPGGKPMSNAQRAIAEQRRAAEKGAVRDARASVEAAKQQAEIDHQH